jgi:hypothetical protein
MGGFVLRCPLFVMRPSRPRVVPRGRGQMASFGETGVVCRVCQGCSRQQATGGANYEMGFIGLLRCFRCQKWVLNGFEVALKWLSLMCKWRIRAEKWVRFTKTALSIGVHPGEGSSDQLAIECPEKVPLSIPAASRPAGRPPGPTRRYIGRGGSPGPTRRYVGRGGSPGPTRRYIGRGGLPGPIRRHAGRVNRRAWSLRPR